MMWLLQFRTLSAVGLVFILLAGCAMSDATPSASEPLLEGAAERSGPGDPTSIRV